MPGLETFASSGIRSSEPLFSPPIKRKFCLSTLVFRSASKRIKEILVSCPTNWYGLCSVDSMMLSLPTQEKKVPPQPEDLKAARMDQDFESFLQVAGILEGSYGHLRAEISRLREELEVKNAALAQSLAENERIRAYLSRILESLPCGVLVVNRDLDCKLINPEARRLLNSNSHHGTELAKGIPSNLESLLKELVSRPSGEERVWCSDDNAEARTIAINCAALPEVSCAHGDFVLILRDITEQR